MRCFNVCSVNSTLSFVPLKYSILEVAIEGYVWRQISYRESSGVWSAGEGPVGKYLK